MVVDLDWSFMWPWVKHKWQTFETLTISHRSSGVFLASELQFISKCLPLQQGQGFEASKLVTSVEIWFEGGDLEIFSFEALGSLYLEFLLSSGLHFAVKI